MAIILVVDDERLIGDMLRVVLAPHGQQVLMALSGAEGMKLFQGYRPDLVILDLGMSSMGGLETLKEIRAIDARVPVIMLTALGTTAEESLARQLGVNEFLSKNLSLDVTLEVVRRYINALSRKDHPFEMKVSAGTTESESGSYQGHILVVDDEPLVGEMVRRYFGRRGYRVVTALDGESALAICESERPDLIVLDMYMPGMMGLEVLHELRARNYTGSIVVLSASQDESLLATSLMDGAIDVMAKPVDLERLELVVSVGMLWGKE